MDAMEGEISVTPAGDPTPPAPRIIGTTGPVEQTPGAEKKHLRRCNYPNDLKAPIVIWYYTQQVLRYDQSVGKEVLRRPSRRDCWVHFRPELEAYGVPYKSMTNWLEKKMADKIMNAVAAARKISQKLKAQPVTDPRLLAADAYDSAAYRGEDPFGDEDEEMPDTPSQQLLYGVKGPAPLARDTFIGCATCKRRKVECPHFDTPRHLQQSSPLFNPPRRTDYSHNGPPEEALEETALALLHQNDPSEEQHLLSFLPSRSERTYESPYGKKYVDPKDQMAFSDLASVREYLEKKEKEKAEQEKAEAENEEGEDEEIPDGSKGRNGRPLPPIVIDDPNDIAAIRRARNTLAARTSRQRRYQLAEKRRQQQQQQGGDVEQQPLPSMDQRSPSTFSPSNERQGSDDSHEDDDSGGNYSGRDGSGGDDTPEADDEPQGGDDSHEGGGAKEGESGDLPSLVSQALAQASRVLEQSEQVTAQPSPIDAFLQSPLREPGFRKSPYPAAESKLRKSLYPTTGSGRPVTQPPSRQQPYSPYQPSPLAGSSGEKKTYKGECHCSTVTFSVTCTPPPNPNHTILSCACETCSVANTLFMSSKDPNDPATVRLITGNDSLMHFKGRSFCRNCGVTVFSHTATGGDNQHMIDTRMFNVRLVKGIVVGKGGKA